MPCPPMGTFEGCVHRNERFVINNLTKSNSRNHSKWPPVAHEICCHQTVNIYAGHRDPNGALDGSLAAATVVGTHGRGRRAWIEVEDAASEISPRHTVRQKR